MCPLYGPRHYMNLCKAMQAQAKAMRLTWLNACDGRAGYVRFQGAKKRLAKVKEMNALVSNVVKEVIEAKKHEKYTADHNFGSDKNLENFNFKNLSIGEE